MPAKLDLTGQRFGRLLVVSAAPPKISGGQSCTQWTCRCDCGRLITTYTGGLRSGHTASCGCATNDARVARFTKHGMSSTREHAAWRAMKARCENKSQTSYPNYGGRGISVCARWASFEAFFADMGPRPAGTTIDRVMSNGNYEPGNCRWATRHEQNRNKRSNRFITFDGRTMVVADWAREYGTTSPVISQRWARHQDLRPASVRRVATRSA